MGQTVVASATHTVQLTGQACGGTIDTGTGILPTLDPGRGIFQRASLRRCVSPLRNHVANL